MNAKIVIDCMSRYERGDILIIETLAEVRLVSAQCSSRHVAYKRQNGESNVSSLCNAIYAYIRLERSIDLATGGDLDKTA